MQDFVRYKVQILKNAAYKVVFLSADIDTQMHISIGAAMGNDNIPIITILGGQLNISALMTALQYIDIGTLIDSGITTDALLAMVSSVVGDIHIPVNCIINAQAANATPRVVSTSVNAEATFSTVVWDKIERELSTAINAQVTIDDALYIMNAQMTGLIAAQAIDITSNSIVDVPITTLANCAFSSNILTAAATELSETQTVETTYIMEMATGASLHAPNLSEVINQVSVEVSCIFGLLRWATLADYDVDTLSIVDTETLNALVHTEIL